VVDLRLYSGGNTLTMLPDYCVQGGTYGLGLIFVPGISILVSLLLAFSLGHPCQLGLFSVMELQLRLHFMLRVFGFECFRV